ncbi:MAG TPA: hypothetical protein VGR21_01280 [Cryptosporangiaceae bacterium]|nr:hypothetical protein [Cryptosporangiaceae bacterium]
MAAAFHGWRRPGWRVWVAGAIALFVAGVLLIGRLVGTDEAGQVRDVSAPAPASPSSTLGDDGVVPAGAPNASAVAAVAERFTRAWVNRPEGAGPESATAWWKAVSRDADPTLTAQLRTADPTRIPARAVTGRPQVKPLSPTAAEARVPTDAGTAVLLCVLVEKRWLVTTIDLERAR